MSDDGNKSLETIAGELASDFVNRLVGPSLDETGSLAADWMRYWRMKNWNLVRDRAEKYHEKRKLKGKSVPVLPGVAMLALQSAPFEDDPNIQDMWARLLVNAMDPERVDDVSKLSVRLLSELDPLDAKILEDFESKNILPSRQNHFLIGVEGLSLRAVSNAMGVSQAKARVALYNLHRLGLVADESLHEAYMARSVRQQKTVGIASTGFLRTEGARMHLTALGRALLEACKDEGDN